MHAPLIFRKWRKYIGNAMMAVLPPLNFLTLHYLYFIATCMIASIIFYLTSTPWRSVAYVDSIFLCVSAMTGAGLNTVDLSTLNSFQQAVLFILLILGHAILISLTVLLVRKRAFEAKFKGVSNERERERSSCNPLEVELQARGREPAQGSTGTDIPGESNGHSGKPHPKTSVLAQVKSGEPSSRDEQPWMEDDQKTIGGTPRHHHHRVFPMAGIGARPDLHNHPRDAVPNVPLVVEDSVSGFKGILRGTQKYMASKGLVSRNSQFHDLTPAERDELGGVEYKAVSFLSVVVFLYFILFIIFGMVGVGGWLEVNDPAVTRTNGLSPFWTGAFFAVSAFVNSGMSLLDANMTALQLNAYPLLTMGFLILAGNTLFPCFLRFIIWTMRIMLPDRPRWQSWRITLDFILKHPRRVYTNLFPARHTWYLLGTIVILNGIDWASFELLSIGNKDIESLPTEYRVLDGLFQAIVLMMYVSAYPVTLTMRNTNVYEERSLGIYAHDESPDSPANTSRSNVVMDLIRHHLGRPGLSETSRGYFVHQQIRSQLSHDLWWIALAIFFIAIRESDHYESQPVSFSTFNIIFEVVSAYGCVGVSLGFPGKNYSFCGAWHTVSKLILAAVALRGRHRGLPVAIDKAIMLPSESLAWAEEEDAAMRRDRSRVWAQEHGPVGSV
ncbi:Potassium transporter, putative [Penicillium digitatum PHI26]|uniref:Potassium transporter, putative n=2 Tax=Penicillium digitatum TaxID=36651 RepID=K9GAG3_PEND2|nr:Potassium transporter, putative [Penicillium digitatum Pd1]EKV18900.1 Potassium transporter, putative [Penicillium digitatum PHI26]EKV20910.1 Potassium transporter, putative [Penicillium digitatum Pd1]